MIQSVLCYCEVATSLPTNRGAGMTFFAVGNKCVSKQRPQYEFCTFKYNENQALGYYFPQNGQVMVTFTAGPSETAFFRIKLKDQSNLSEIWKVPAGVTCDILKEGYHALDYVQIW
jgi:hypothetical protein